MTAPLLEVTRVDRRFGSTVALAAVSLSLSPGEVVALLGENGAGKSTLVEVISGGLRPDSGRLAFAGARYAPRDPRQAREAGIGVVHRHFRLVEAFTVAENLALSLGALPPSELLARRSELERELGFEPPPPAAPVGQLTVGQRQWVEIARALLGRPRLLLLDEPTAVLTPSEADRLFATVRRLKERGTAVLFITHRLDEVRRVADRVLVLRRGRVMAERTADAPSGELATAMTGEELEPVRRPERAVGPVVARLVGVAVPPRLAPLDLELRAGEVVVLAGVDGGGQVEAAERLAGLVGGPGVVELGGEVVGRADPHTLRALGVTMVPADRSRQGVVSSLSVAENLALGSRLSLPLRPAELADHAWKLIRSFAIVGRPEQPAGELSGGNQQRLVVARALAGRPRIVAAVHPTRGLDVAGQRAVRRLLLQAAAAGAALLVVTSDLDEARELGDRLLVLSRGRVVGMGDRATPTALLARWVGGEAA